MGNVARLEYLLCESGSAKVREATAWVEKGLSHCMNQYNAA